MSLQSTVSLGRVGRVLGGDMKLTSRSGSKESISRATTPEVKTPDTKTPPEGKTPTLATEPVAAVAASSNTNPAVVLVVNCAEPDIVASAKASIQTDQPETAVIDPVAPPRRRRKPLAPNPPTMVSLPVASPSVEPALAASTAVAASPTVPIAIVAPLPVSNSAPSLCPPTTNSVPVLVAAPPPSPGSSLEPGSKWTINSLTNKGQQEFSLDLKSALKGNYVIKPQVLIFTISILVLAVMFYCYFQFYL